MYEEIKMHHLSRQIGREM